MWQPPRCDPEPVRTFDTFTGDLHRFADWFEQCRVTTVALESTGVDWIPLSELLTQRGFVVVVVVNAREVKQVPDRKTDVGDAQWRQRLHEYGLLRASFHPHGEIATLRSSAPARAPPQGGGRPHPAHAEGADPDESAAPAVVADSTGQTGLRIIRALVAGERDPDRLAALRDGRCKTPLATLRAALVGKTGRSTSAPGPRRSSCMRSTKQRWPPATSASRPCWSACKPTPSGAAAPPRSRRPMSRPCRCARPCMRSPGVDLTQIDGIGPYLALKLVSECGPDLAAWLNAQHFTSWLGLALHNKISGLRRWAPSGGSPRGWARPRRHGDGAQDRRPPAPRW
ncbi:transposase [Microvirga sp. KLBC 81]|uniref:transposase n=1 Tax=Microvirga sp. KLBC 81 TaxID=1862707 RepID=UPI0026BCB749